MKNKLTKSEQRLVSLIVDQKIKEFGRFEENDLERLAAEIEVDQEVIRRHVNMQPSKVEPVKVDKIPASPRAESIRSALSPREGITIMNPLASAEIEQNPPNYQLNRTKYSDAVYRGNKPTKRS